jgi:septin family protein
MLPLTTSSLASVNGIVQDQTNQNNIKSHIHLLILPLGFQEMGKRNFFIELISKSHISPNNQE